jgi:phosphoribosyl 1,2-cyclic phosphate phosphodiesterase
VLDALKRTPHPTHLSLDESIALLKELRPRRAYLTHMGHDLDYDQIRRQLPKGIFIPYDGLTLRL